ncbi:hypothetical protein Btru_034153 [Bulinus truncatus]|nr:hypothetical protein Btru_034153 [Bulinus truncatus]
MCRENKQQMTNERESDFNERAEQSCPINQFIIPEFVQFTQRIDELFWRAKANTHGQLASYIPQLTRFNPESWGLAICTVDGKRYALGDAYDPVCLQSVSKPLTYAMVLDELGPDVVHQYVGQEPSGQAFNTIGLDPKNRPHNPMVNAGAVVICSLLKQGMNLADKFDYNQQKLRQLAGNEFVSFNNSIFLSERQTADRNFAIGYYLKEKQCFPRGANLHELLDFYFQLCSVETTCDSGAVVAATLANGGICPTTGVKVLEPYCIRDTLSLMLSCGMYDYSGQFAFKIVFCKMPKPVVTSRELKNKESGIDLYVTAFSEQKGLMTNVVQYQVVLVSNLSCFKTPSHKESDVVQYSLEKKMNEFEDLRTTLSEMFPNTVLPIINKKSIIVNELVLRERRNSLDHLLKFIASIPKLAMSVPLLEFLGVDYLRAKKFSIGEPLESTTSPIVENEEIVAGDDTNVDFLLEQNGEQDENDLFALQGSEQEVTSFEEKKDSNTVLMFEEQDLKRELTEDDEKNFQFIPDAIIKKKETVKIYKEQIEDHSDLFEIEDDLDRFLTIDVGKKKSKPPEKETSQPTTSLNKPPILSKPALSNKPPLPAKPNAAGMPIKDLNSSGPSSKPVISAKPKISLSDQSHSKVDSQEKVADDLGQDDILKYLQENLAAATEDVDLFS